MPNLDFDNWSHEILAALTGVGAALGWGRLLDYWNEGRRKRAEARVEEEAREDQERAIYQSRLHDDYLYLREELRKTENLHRECERDRLRIEAELFRLREQVQILQFKHDILEEEVAALRN